MPLTQMDNGNIKFAKLGVIYVDFLLPTVK